MKVGKSTYTIDGERVSEEEYLKRMKAKGKLEGAPYVSRAWEKPLESEALAVDPRHVEFEKQIDAEQGLRVDYDGHGRPVFTSRQQRNEYVRAKGYFDNNASYGDVAPRNK
jgi:hypothetical protein